MSTSNSSSSNRALFVYKYQTKCVLAARQTLYQEAIQTCRNLFPTILPNNVITLHTDELDICDGQMTEISEGLWEQVVEQLKSVTVFDENRADPATLAAPPPYTVGGANAPGAIIIHVTLDDMEMAFRVQKLTKFEKVIHALIGRLGPDINDSDITFTFNGRRINADDTIESIGIQDDGTIEGTCVQR